MTIRRKKWGVALAVALTASAMATTTQAAGKPSAAAKQGGEITYGILNTISGWCFANALTGDALGATRMVYESLVERDSKGNFIPHLAESWAPSEGGKVWTFTLRSGIKFSNGEDFNAEVVKLNLDLGRGAVISGKIGNYTYTNLAFGSTGVGVNANILSVEASNATTVKVTLERPDNDFLGLMYRAGRYVMRAPGQIMTADGKANTAAGSSTACANLGIGTGPFKILSWNPNELVVERNPLYWRKDASGTQLPYLNKITVVVVKEASQRAAALRKGVLDVASFTTGEATFVKDLKQRKSVVTEYAGNVGSWGQWLPNQDKAGSPFKNQNCRLAASHAVDWKTYNKVRFKGLGVYSGSIVGKEHIMFTTSGTPAYDVAKAKEYVAKCNTDLGAAGPFKLTLYADTSSQSLNNVKEVQKYMEAAGIVMNPIFQAESAVLIASIYSPTANKYDFAEGTPAEGPGSGYVLPFFVTGAFPKTSTNPIAKTTFGGIYNKVIAIANHSDTQVDNLLYAAQAETDPAARKSKFQAATAYLQSTGTAIPTVHTATYTFVNKKSMLMGIGQVKNPDGKTFAPTKDIKGFEWTGIWQSK
ncbi:MAG: ABC transporter substrate-binding protein [Acidimicrobiales bacterium]